MKINELNLKEIEEKIKENETIYQKKDDEKKEYEINIHSLKKSINNWEKEKRKKIFKGYTTLSLIIILSSLLFTISTKDYSLISTSFPIILIMPIYKIHLDCSLIKIRKSKEYIEKLKEIDELEKKEQKIDIEESYLDDEYEQLCDRKYDLTHPIIEEPITTCTISQFKPKAKILARK